MSEAQPSPAEPILNPQIASSPIQSLRLVETPASRNETLSPNALSFQTTPSSHDSDGDVEEEEEEEDEMDASMTQSMLSLPPPGVIASTILSEHGSDGSPSSTMYLSAASSVRAHTPPALTLQELDNPLLASPSPDPESDSPVTPTYATTALPASNQASSSPVNNSTNHSHIDRFPAPNPLISNTTPTPVPAHEIRSPEVSKQEVPSYHILSFGKDPILISLMTPPPTGAKGPSAGTTAVGIGGPTGLDPGVPSPPRPSTMGKGRKEYKGIMVLSVKLGVLAVAMDVEHINALMSIGDAVTPKAKEKKIPKPKKLIPSSSPVPSLLDEIEGSFSLRAVHVFLFDTSLSPSKGILNVRTQPLPTRDAQEERMNVGLVMWNDILSQPTSIMIKENHIRAHLDTLSLNFALGDDRKRKVTGGIKDFSVFWIGRGVTVISHPPPSLKEDSPNEIDASRDNDGANKEQWLASPVLVVDHHLASQYDPVSIDIRESLSPYSIPVTDWTNPSSHTSSAGRPKISLWRAKPLPHKNDRDYSHGLGKPTDSEDLEAAIWQIELHTGVSSIEIAPLHFFVDTRMLQWFLGLVQRIQLPASSPTGTPGYPATEYDHPYVESTPPPRGGRGWMASSLPENAGYLPRAPRSPVRTPKTQVVELIRLSAEQEKQRLRDFVLSDIEMATPRQNTGDESGLHVRCAVIRCEVRCGPTTPYPRLTKRKLPRQRSGAIILDIHHPHVALPNSAVAEARKNSSLPHGPNVERKLQFVPYGLDGEEGDYNELPLKMRFEWNDILAFYAVPVAIKATPFLRIGEPSQTQHMQDAMETQVEQSMRPTALMRSGTLISQQNQSMSSAPPSMTLVEVAIPSIVTTIDKPILGGLQLWSDDMAQWAEKVAGLSTSAAASQTTSRAQSVLIGSRYFVRRTASNVGEEPESPTYSEFSVKVNITEAKIRLRMPTRGDLVRNVDVIASNINTGIEVKPGGRDETAILARIMDITLQDTHSNQTKVLFALTLPRRLFASPSPMISLRLDSLSLPDSKSKQSRIHLTTSKFTFSVYPEFDLIEDLARFVKAPPGVFEQVIPTERTVLDVNIKDGSIRVIPPNHPGCLVLNLEDVSFGTDIVANSTESSVAILGRLAHVLLVDDQEAPVPEALQTGEVNRGFDHWLKLGYARLLDAANLHVRTVYIAGDIPRTRVDISDAIASIRLCADTIPTLAALIGDLATLIPKEETNPTIGVTAVQSSSDQSQASMSS
ncbi:autophagy- protein 2, partial [Serendipita sp. 399]